MALSVFDGAMGLIPAEEVKKFVTFKQAAAGVVIYKGMPLMLTGGYAVPYDENTSPTRIVGVAAEYHAASPGVDTDVVCYPPDIDFFILGNGNYVQTTDPGLYVGFAANGADNGPDTGTNYNSDCHLVNLASGGAAVPTALLPVRIVGLAEIINNSATAVAGKTPVLRVQLDDSMYSLRA